MGAPTKSPIAHMGRNTLYESLDFNVDRYLNPWIPHNRLGYVPQPIRHFLGYRSKPHVEPPAVIQWVLTFIATLGGLCLVGGVFNFAPGVVALGPPAIVASLGATAVLDYNAVRSPLAQPRNAIVGQVLSAVMGVAIAKAFQLDPSFFANYPWVSGAVGCACASLVMSMSNTVHPPGGATAVLASTEATIVAMGWMFVPLVLLGTVLMTSVACVLNNTLRQYPTYWWTPEDVGRKLRSSRREAAKAEEDTDKLEKQVSEADSERTLRRELSNSVAFLDDLQEVQILPYKIQMPKHMEVTPDEVMLLQHLQERIRMLVEVGD